MSKHVWKDVQTIGVGTCTVYLFQMSDFPDCIVFNAFVVSLVAGIKIQIYLYLFILSVKIYNVRSQFGSL